MASIRTRTTKSGAASHTVNWRDPELGFKSRTYQDRHRAQELKDFLDANNNTFRLAAEAKTIKVHQLVTVTEAVHDHVQRLRTITDETRRDYVASIDHHLARTDLGTQSVVHVTAGDVTDWLDGLQRRRRPGPMSAKSKRNLHSMLSAALARQVEAGAISVNPAAGLAPRVRASSRRRAVFLSPEAMQRMIDLSPQKHRLLLRVLASTGLRWGEATALQPRHVAPGPKGRVVLQVRQAWKRGHVLGDPKTDRSVRDVVCSTHLSGLIRRHLNAGAQDQRWLFENAAGGEVLNADFHRTPWSSLSLAMVEEGFTIRRPEIQHLRHSHCSQLLQQRVPVHVVQARLGHESPQTTLGVYAQTTLDDDLAAADAAVW